MEVEPIGDTAVSTAIGSSMYTISRYMVASGGPIAVYPLDRTITPRDSDIYYSPYSVQQYLLVIIVSKLEGMRSYCPVPVSIVVTPSIMGVIPGSVSRALPIAAPTLTDSLVLPGPYRATSSYCINSNRIHVLPCRYSVHQYAQGSGQQGKQC